jgi:endonuclease-3
MRKPSSSPTSPSAPLPAQLFPIEQALDTLERELTRFTPPLIDQMGEVSQTPFRILIATILSLRTKDTLTAVVAPRLFAVADTPAAMLALGVERIAELIYPVGFYRVKARQIVAICQILLERYGGEVPSDLDELLKLPGVGRKTANLVVTAGFGLPGICVDIHVHRICNRWGYVQTRTPEETEIALRARLPQRYWIPINRLLVTLGQNICHPTSPRCSICPIRDLCPRIGVTRSR